MAYNYNISAKFNIQDAMKNINTLLNEIEKVEKKSNGLGINIHIDNAIIKQVQAAKNLQQQFRTSLKDAEAVNKAISQAADLQNKNAENAKKRAAQTAKEEQKLQTEIARTNNEREKGEQRAQKAAQDRANAQRKADIENATAANKYAEQAVRSEQRIQQEKERTKQTQLGTMSAMVSFADRLATAQERQANREERAREKAWRAQKKAQDEQRKMNEEIARDLEHQARKEEAVRQIEEANTAETKELKDAIEDAHAAQERFKATVENQHSTVRQMVKAYREMEEANERLANARMRANSPFSGIMDKIGNEGSWTKGFGRMGAILSKSGEVLQGISQAYNSLQSGAKSVTNSIWSTAKGFFDKVISGFSDLTQQGMEAFGTLEMAEIGFSNFFDGSATELTKKIRKEAEKMPMVGAADLARSIQYIAPLAGGNAALALGATQGVMKAITYSGNDVSQVGTKALQNLTQIASGNMSAIDIREMMRQMPAITRLLKSTDTGGELLENGQITTKRVKDYVAKYGSEAILDIFKQISEKSEAADIYDIANMTFKGAQEELKEKLTNAWMDAFDQSGAEQYIKGLIKELVDGGVIDRVFNAITNVVRKIVNWLKDNEEPIKQVLSAIYEGLKHVVEAVKEVATELLQSIGILDSAGKLNISGLKKVIGDITAFLRGLVKGFGGGLQSFINLLQKVQELLGEDGFAKLGEVIGWLASPMGKLSGTLLQVGSNALRAAGGIANMMSNSLKDGGLLNKGLTSFVQGTGNLTSKAGGLVEKVSGGKFTQAGFVSGAKTVAGVAGKAVTGLGIAALGQTIMGLTDTFMELNGASQTAQTAVQTLEGGITGAAAGFAMFGPHGAIIGGIIGAVAGFVKEMAEYQEKLRKERQEQYEQKSDIIVTKGQEDIRNHVLNSLKEAGLEIDRDTLRGRFVSDMLDKEIKARTEIYETDDKYKSKDGDTTRDIEHAKKDAEGNAIVKQYTIDNIDWKELAEIAAGWERQKQIMEEISTFTASEEFLNAGGTKIDFRKDKARRNQLVDLIKQNEWLGSENQYDYSKAPEGIALDYLDSIDLDGMTDKQLEALQNQYNKLDQEITPKTTDIATNMMNVSTDLAENGWLADEMDGLSTYELEGNALLQSILDELHWVAVNTKGIDGSKYGLDNRDLKNEQAWHDAAYKNTSTSGALNGSPSFKDPKTGLLTDPSLDLTNPAGNKAGLLNTRQAWAEYHGKDPKANDDFDETMAKLKQAYNEYSKKRGEAVRAGDHTTFQTYNNKMSAVTDLEKELNKIRAGDWDALFTFQKKAEETIGDVVKFRAGGGILERLLSGRGRGVDTVPAFLQPGEFVMRRSAVAKAGVGAMDAINRGDFSSAIHALGNRFNNSWDNSHHWNSSNTVNNNNSTTNYFFSGGLAKGRRGPYYSMANRVATL